MNDNGVIVRFLVYIFLLISMLGFYFSMKSNQIYFAFGYSIFVLMLFIYLYITEKFIFLFIAFLISISTSFFRVFYFPILIEDLFYVPELEIVANISVLIVYIITIVIIKRKTNNN